MVTKTENFIFKTSHPHGFRKLLDFNYSHNSEISQLDFKKIFYVSSLANKCVGMKNTMQEMIKK